jgi:hypothetical protein
MVLRERAYPVGVFPMAGEEAKAEPDVSRCRLGSGERRVAIGAQHSDKPAQPFFRSGTLPLEDLPPPFHGPSPEPP